MTKVIIKFDTKKILNKLDPMLVSGMEKTLIGTLDEINRRELVPRRSGVLEKAAKVEFDKATKSGYISWNTPYADRLYRGLDFKFLKVFNSGAQAYWNRPVTNNDNTMKNIIRIAFKDDTYR